MKVTRRETKLAESKDILKDIIIQCIQDKKGEDIISLDLQHIHESVTDYFIICHVISTTQVKAIANHIIEKVEETTGERPWHKEGLNNLEWALIDYVSVVVHVFIKEKREFYHIEELWQDAKVTRHDD